MGALGAFPSLTEQEFFEACQSLECRSSDKINDTDWLSVRWTGKELLIKQKRKLSDQNHQNPKDDDEANRDDTIEEGMEDTIYHNTLVPRGNGSDFLIVDFSITISPTYQVPVLWFSCHFGLDQKPLSLDQVYRWMVPQTLHDSLRRVSVMGGISMAHHPVSDLPAFFLHPCNTPEALSVLRPDEPLTPEGYLILWLGLVGSVVGLHVPSKLFDHGVG
ncbi:uncharacterized protein Z518_10555 [Rhinocladiella mackenziei CBS 650.93]|uniref:Ubiquitin-like-conjugating enzyme ATG10 n=1 Tax=Rhinocladiella mackenziei CBS 650.93 TaxID=1442369 RepID=A0A0D2IAW1_9EURO|nr:uncharacterized protein Z518_10555 [Rhinocladiella mackenziei CBS 650.93]KIX00416.1 hypothetical protein Z518_10555 [Rhinocladiella mackenziei CBS 650.93]